MGPERWLRLAGFGTWVATVVPALASIAAGRLTGVPLIVWSAAALTFVGAFAAFCWLPAARQHRGVAAATLVVQAVSALTMASAGRDSLAAGVLLVVVAGQLMWVVGTRTAALWIAVQTLLLVVAFTGFMATVSAIAYGSAFGGFQLFALGTAALAHRERRAREAADIANAELRATRALMAEHTRVAERLRISRDLHDTLGHHLTAASLQLDVAARLTEGRAAAHVSEAHALVRLLLADVRDVVSRLREGGRFDLVQALRSLAVSSSGDTLSIHVDTPDDIPLADDEQAQALLRCAQEIVTNTMRHARARHLRLSIEIGPTGVTVRGRDDGRGASSLAWGNGLTGMRERLEAVNGRLDVVTRGGDGFEVSAFVPRAQGVS